MDKKPVFSIIIPTYNRPQQLSTCLESFTRLDYPRDRFEVIIVDDGSPMPLDAVVAPFQEQLIVELIRQNNAGPATARNTGSIHAHGQFLAFTDDDCQPAPNWLQALEQGFREFPNALLGGHTINKLSENIYSEASQILLDYVYSYYNSDPNQAHFFASNNLALATDHFYSCGSFNTTFPLAAAEDREFCDSWLYQGYKMIYIPEVTVYHAHKLNLQTFCLQHFNYGRGAFSFHRNRIQRTNESIKVEPLQFYLNLLIYPLIQNSSQPGILVSILFLISQVANVAGFFWEHLHQSKNKLN
ncbi:glycosyltransferase family 2 protein [Nostoc sp.]